MCRIPGLCSKLSDSWEGPYIVGERMGSVNYKIYREGKKKSAKVIHVNCLKRYLDGASICRLDVVVEDDTESKQKLVGECEGFVKEELEELLVKYEGLFSGTQLLLRCQSIQRVKGL